MRKALTMVAISMAMMAANSASAHDYKVGTHMALTGSLARVGNSMWQGIQIAADLFNLAEKGKNTVELSVIDDESSPAKAVAAVEQLGPKVDAFVGGFGSNLVGPASETSDRLGKVYVTGGAVAKGIVERGLKGFFRVNNNEGYAKAIDQFAAQIGVKSMSILYSTKDATADVAKQVEGLVNQRHVKVTMHAFEANVTDFKPTINKIKLQDRPDMILMSGYENDYVGILRAAQILKPDVKMFVGTFGLATEQMNRDFHDVVQNVAGTAVLSYPPIFTTADGKNFSEAFKTKFGNFPDYNAVYGYVAAQVLFTALGKDGMGEKVGQPGVLSAEVRKTDMETLLGHVSFNEKGDNPSFVQRIAQHQGNNLVLVSPLNAATGKAVVPGRPW